MKNVMFMHKQKSFVILMPLLALVFSCNPQKKLAKQKHEYMEQTYVDVKAAVSQAEVTIVNDSLKVLFPSNLLFSKGGSGINPETYPIMERFAGVLLKYSRTNVLINGYTDTTGTQSINQKLSKARADSAGAVLILYKVPESRLTFWGHGSNNPIGDNTTEEGRSRNRRVEFVILYRVEE